MSGFPSQGGSGVPADGSGALGWIAKNGQAGILVPTMQFPGALANSGFTANRVNVSRFVLLYNFTVTNVGFRSVGAGTGNIDVGILDAAGNRLGSSGSIAGKKGATTNQTLALTASVALIAGTIYHAAVESDTSDGTYLGVGAAGAEQLFGTTIGIVEGYIKDTTFPIPAAVPLGFITNAGPIMVLS